MSTTAATLRAEIARLQKELSAATRRPALSARRESKADLLLAASQKDVGYFLQFDAFPELADGGLNKGRLKQGPVVVADDHGESAPKLADAGISKDLSSRAQKLAAVPEEEFETEADDFEGVPF